MDQRGGIITGWLFRILFGLAIFGLAVFEAGAVIVARLTVDRIAIEASEEAGLECGRTRSSAKAAIVAEHIAARSDALIEGKVVCDLKFNVVKVTVTKKASTLFVTKIPGLKDVGDTRATHTGRIR